MLPFAPSSDKNLARAFELLAERRGSAGLEMMEVYVPTLAELQPVVGPALTGAEEDGAVACLTELGRGRVLQPPRPMSWLAGRPAGQSFEQFAAGRNRPRPRAPRDVIYLVPLGPIEEAFMGRVRELVASFVMVETHVLAPLSLSSMAIMQRERRGRRQLFSPDLLSHLSGVIPSNAFVMVGVTMEELYYSPTRDDFELSCGLPGQRVLLLSLSRLDPNFYDPQALQNSRNRYWRVLLRRTLKLVAREVLGFMGLSLCPFLRCCMAGSTSIDEFDENPVEPCPICLKKMWLSVRFDPVERSGYLGALYNRIGFRGEYTEQVELRKRLKEARESNALERTKRNESQQLPRHLRLPQPRGPVHVTRRLSAQIRDILTTEIQAKIDHQTNF